MGKDLGSVVGLDDVQSKVLDWGADSKGFDLAGKSSYLMFSQLGVEEPG